MNTSDSKIYQEKDDEAGASSRGRPKRRSMDAVKEDMKLAGVTEEDAG